MNLKKITKFERKEKSSVLKQKIIFYSFQIRGQSYDLVLNGSEVGGGSLRIHNSQLQTEVLKKLNIERKTMTHLLNALASGCPPHGGIALGLDRLLATMLKANSIRDVIAFPKGVDGKDHMSGAPVKISEQEKKLYHLTPKQEQEINGENLASKEMV